MPESVPPDHLLGRPSNAVTTEAVTIVSEVTPPVPPGLERGTTPEGVDWHRYTTAVLRHRWWIVAGTVLGLAGGMFATRILKPQYRVQATVWVDVANHQDPNRGPIRQGQLLESYSWVDLLRSFAVLDNVVRELKLYVALGSPIDSLPFASFDIGERFRPGSYRLAVDADGRHYTLSSDRVPLERGALGDSIGRSLGFRWAPPEALLPPGRVIAFGLVPPRDAAQHLSSSLSVHLDENGNFMSLELMGTNAGATATALNGIVQRYVEVAAELKRAKLTELTHILDNQLTTAATNLHEAESALESFRVRTITLPSEQATPLAPGLEATRDPVFKNFFDMRIEREQLRRDREAIEAVLAHLDDSDAVQGLEVVGTVQHSAPLMQALQELTAKQAELRAIRYRYTDAYPGGQRVAHEIVELERQTIPSLARTLLVEIAARQQVLDSLVASASSDLRQIPQRAVEEARLRREVTIAENLYTTLQQRYEEARLAEASTIPDVRVLDAAVAPQRPLKNTAPRFVLLGLCGGFAVSVLGVLVVDRIDRRVRYPQQVTREMGLAILGAVPRLPRRSDAADQTKVTQVIEALRTVRLNVSHAHPARPIVLTVTSPGPGDGKSFIASNLARAFADGGQRTLLIDGDARRGVLHRVLGAARKPGLIDCLADRVSLEGIIQPTDHPLMRLITSGTRQGDAPELLGSPTMVRILAWARAHYDVVIVDSPPLGAGVDPFVLSTLTGNMILVLRTGATDRTLAQFKLEGIDRLPIRVLGAILNDVRPSGVYRYYGYLSGYAAEGESQAGDLAARNMS